MGTPISKGVMNKNKVEELVSESKKYRKKLRIGYLSCSKAVENFKNV